MIYDSSKALKNVLKSPMFPSKAFAELILASRAQKLSLKLNRLQRQGISMTKSKKIGILALEQDQSSEYIKVLHPVSKCK